MSCAKNYISLASQTESVERNAQSVKSNVATWMLAIIISSQNTGSAAEYSRTNSSCTLVLILFRASAI